MELTINLSGLEPAVARGVIQGLRHEDKAQHDLGVLEQVRLKQLADAVMRPGANTKVGRAVMVLSPSQAAMARRLYGELCFADPEFSRWLLKHNPEFRVRDVGTRIQSGYTGKGSRRTRSPLTPALSPQPSLGSYGGQAEGERGKQHHA